MLEDGANNFFSVYGNMFRTISRDYSSLPDPRTLRACEIRFYYDGLRYELLQSTKSK